MNFQKLKLGKVRRFMLNDFLKGQVIEEGNEKIQLFELKKVIMIPEEYKTEYETLKDYIEKNYNTEVTLMLI